MLGFSPSMIDAIQSLRDMNLISTIISRPDELALLAANRTLLFVENEGDRAFLRNWMARIDPGRAANFLGKVVVDQLSGKKTPHQYVDVAKTAARLLGKFATDAEISVAVVVDNDSRPQHLAGVDRQSFFGLCRDAQGISSEGCEYLTLQRVEAGSYYVDKSAILALIENGEAKPWGRDARPDDLSAWYDQLVTDSLDAIEYRFVTENVTKMMAAKKSDKNIGKSCFPGGIVQGRSDDWDAAAKCYQLVVEAKDFLAACGIKSNH
ncbi:uncharacterized protein EV422DRAFT_513247, partial [Fimicolochytrium jonesii]|uniref:uncharacterized protein n=1 Tax=Fimicolochytrium jonesii TaxID=1396493 RepID=UPI0022FDFE20